MAKPDRVPHGSGWLPTWTWARAHTADADSLRTVLLVHGWEGRGSQLGAFVPPLLSRGFRVVTFDAPGHGDSPLARASLVEHARTLGLDARVKDAMLARFEARYAILFEDLDVRADAARLIAPLLVVHDSEDPVVGFANGEAIAQASIARFIEGPHATFAETLDRELFIRQRRWTTARL